jgi:hypothetical protein
VLKLAAGKIDLDRHLKSNKHLSNVRIIGKTNIVDAINNNDQQKKKDIIIAAEIELVFDGIDLNLSFRQISDFVKRRTESKNPKIMFKDIKIARTKVRGIVLNVIDNLERRNMVRLMQTKKWSLMVDEGTDRGKIKSLALIVRITDNGHIKDYFYNLLETSDGTGKGLFKAIQKQLQADNVQFWKNMVGYASDGANVVLGQTEGLDNSKKWFQIYIQ